MAAVERGKQPSAVEDGSTSRPSRSSGAGPKAIAQSAYQLFRAQWLADQRVAGRRLAAHEGHQESRSAWQALPFSKYEGYRDLASARRQQVDLARQSAVPHRESVAASDSTEALAIPTSAQNELPRRHVAVDDWFCGHCGVAADAKVESYNDLSFSGTSVPFSSRMAALFDGTFSKRVTIKEAEREFKRRVEQTPPESAVRAFRDVSYRTSCGALCRLHTNKAILALQDRLVKDWVGLVQSLAPRGRISQVPLCDIVFAVEVYGASASVVMFVSVVVGMGKWFRYSPQLGFAFLLAVTPVDAGQCYTDICLRQERIGFVAPAAAAHPLGHLPKACMDECVWSIMTS